MTKHRKPIIGITPDIYDRSGVETWRVAGAYADCVSRAGGVPVVLSPMVEHVRTQLGMVDAAVLTGGDDPIMEDFGEATHAEAVRVLPKRQEFERALLDCLHEDARDVPVLGICLGMQYMGLCAGGKLDQHMPETTPTAGDHWEEPHRVACAHSAWSFGDGEVFSKHRQAITDEGALEVLARAHDGVIEAVGDPVRRFWVGVQWHPERTNNAGLGQAIFDALIGAARG